MTSGGHEVDIHVERERSTLIDFIIEHELLTRTEEQEMGEAWERGCHEYSVAVEHGYITCVL